MIIISLDREEMAAGRKFAKNISSQNKNPNGYIKGFRNKFISDFVGIIGEIAVGKYLELPVDMEVYQGNDGKYDFIYHDRTIDVKANSYPNGQLYFYSHRHFKADIAVLTVPLVKEEYSYVKIAGWISKEEFMDKSQICNYGYHDNVCVKQKDLNDIQILKEG